MATAPEQYLDLLEKKVAFASLATLMADGTPQVTPVWFDFRDGRIRVNTAKGRLKDKNMRNSPSVALAIVDPQNPYRYIQVRGRVTHVTEDGADAHIDSLAMKYMGKETYPYRNPAEVRVIYEVEPVSFQGMG